MQHVRAFEVRAGDDGEGCVVFAANNAAARRRGAGELGVDWEDVDSCRRAPAFDVHAPGPVPQTVLIAHGWWMECRHCQRKVSNDMASEPEEEGLDPDAFTPVDTADQRGVFCGQACAAEHFAESRARQAAQANLIELVEAKFPGAKVGRVHVYGTRLESSAPGDGVRCSAQFTFPGAKYGATFIFGDPRTHVSQEDVPVFLALYGGQLQAAGA